MTKTPSSDPEGLKDRREALKLLANSLPRSGWEHSIEMECPLREHDFEELEGLFEAAPLHLRAEAEARTFLLLTMLRDRSLRPVRATIHEFAMLNAFSWQTIYRWLYEVKGYPSHVWPLILLLGYAGRQTTMPPQIASQLKTLLAKAPFLKSSRIESLVDFSASGITPPNRRTLLRWIKLCRPV